MAKRFLTNPLGKKDKGAKGKKNTLATEPAPTVESAPESNEAPAPAIPATGSPERRMTTMELTLTRSEAPRKSKRLVIYNIDGRKGSIQFLSTLFGGSQNDVGNPPAQLKLVGEFAEPKQPKPKETPEERKARLAALPKPTLEEKVKKAEERAARLREKLAKASNPAA